MRKRSFGGRTRPSHFSNKKKITRKPRKVKSVDIQQLVNTAKQATAAEKPKEYIPKYKFNEFELDNRLKQNITRKGYQKPTPIQDQAIPQVLKGKDVVGIANTGTGKTAAFLLPMLHKVIRDRRQKVIILAPTRELAMQIEQEFIGFAKSLGIHSVLCIGGTNMRNQIDRLRKRHHFIIGTPGRVKDLIDRRLIHIHTFQNVILDEADRMLDMGFINEIKKLLSQLPKERHSLFFSATISKQIEELINTFLTNPITISVKVGETAANVHQEIVKIYPDQKRLEVLQNLLKKEEFKKVLVFGRTKHGVDKLSKTLFKKGFKVDSIHGDKKQNQRQRALKAFKDYKVKILVATDVAARGLDIDNVSHVINFDIPSTHDDYIHRIGRTGRGEKKGIALTFVDEKR